MAQANYRALLIGNSQFLYDSQNLKSLEGPANDVALLKAALIHPEVGLFAPEHVRLLPDRTMEEIQAEMNEFFASATRHDCLLLYYSGHGLLNENNQLFLCARNTKSDRLFGTAVSSFVIDQMLRASAARTNIIILDCCHSGAFKGGNLPEALRGEGRFVLTSCRGEELANDADRANGTSRFTQHLIDGLLTEAPDLDGDGYVDLEELYDYVHKRLTTEGKQRPQRHFGGGGEVFIARRRAAAATGAHGATAELPLDLRDAIESQRAGIKYGAVVELGRMLRSSKPALVQAARDALTSLADDDSRSVAEAAAKVLAEYTEAQARRAAQQAAGEQLAREGAEADRLAALTAQTEGRAREQAEQERLAREKAEAERLAAQQAEAERRVHEKAEQERLARERAEAERLAARKANEERRARELADRQRLLPELRRREQERLAREKAEAERLAAQRAEEEQRARERAQIAALVQEAETAMGGEDWAAAIDKCQQALALEPSNTEAASGLKQARWQQDLAHLYAAGCAHQEAGRVPEALQEFRRLRELEGDYKDVTALIAAVETRANEERKRMQTTALVREAETAMGGENWEDAIDRCQQALALDPSHTEAAERLQQARRQQEALFLYGRGLDRREAGFRDDALYDFRRVREMVGDYKDVEALIAHLQGTTAPKEPVSASPAPSLNREDQNQDQIVKGNVVPIAVVGVLLVVALLVLVVALLVWDAYR